MLLFGLLLHVAVPANVGTVPINEVFVRFRLAEPAILMVDVSYVADEFPGGL